MQRNEGVHLHAVQEDLDHDETRRFECESSTLAEEPNELKVDFTVSGCKWKGLAWVAPAGTRGRRTYQGNSR